MRWVGNPARVRKEEDAFYFGGKTSVWVVGWYYNISQRNKISKGYIGLTSIRTVKSGVSFEHNEPSRSLKGWELLA